MNSKNNKWRIEVRKVRSYWEYRVFNSSDGSVVTYPILDVANKPIGDIRESITSRCYPISILRPTADGCAMSRRGAIRKAKYHMRYAKEILERATHGEVEWEIVNESV